MSRPDRVLIALAAGRPLPKPDDVDRLLRSAREHSMGGLLWSAVTVGVLDLPEGAHYKLARRDLRVRHRHIRLWEALGELNARFDRAGIEVATIKGVPAETRWYDRMGERPCVDLDLYLPPTELDKLEECVAIIDPGHPMRGLLHSAVVEGGMQSIQLLGPGGVAVDLHVDPLKLGIRTRDANRIWERTTPVPTPGEGKTRALDAETSLILFLFHVLKDRLSYLLGLTDVVRIVDREELDWAFIDDFVRGEGLEVPAYLTLTAIYETLGLDPPVTPEIGGWRTTAWRTLWPERVRLLGPEGRVRHHRRQAMLPLLGRGRAKEGLGRIWHAAFPPEVVLDYHDPETTGPYPWRLVIGRWRRIRDRRATARSLADK